MANYQGRKYFIEKYNPDWVNKFKKEAEILSRIFNDLAVSIDHIGSTAIPGLGGKSTIDILVMVKNLKEIEKIIPDVVTNGYIDKGQHVTENSRLFVREENNERLVNVHVFPKNHVHVREMLAVRDYLRSHPEKVKEYNNLKKSFI